MRIYILVEGEGTEIEMYPKWFSYLLPEFKQLDFFNEEGVNSFFLFSGQGIPSIYNHAVNAIKDINLTNNFDYLFVCLDAENASVDIRKEKLLKHLEKNQAELQGKCKLKIIVHNACVESWFLGNRKIVKENPHSQTLRDYLNYYNVKKEDPELMLQIEPFKTKAQFHFSYLREVFLEHNLSYKKTRPKHVLDKQYLDELLRRIDETTDLNSFRDFINIIEEIKAKT